MRFDPIDTFDPERQATGPVARAKRWPTAASSAIALSAGVAVLTFVADTHARFVIGGVLLLVGLLIGRSWLAVRSPRAWLVAVDAQALSAMLRSPFATPIDPHESTVVTLAWGELAWARQARIVRIERGPKNRRRRIAITYLDVALAPGVDVAPLAAAIERARETRTRFRTTHTQAQLVDGNVLRLEYRSNAVSMRPSIAALLGAMSDRVAIAPEVRQGP